MLKEFKRPEEGNNFAEKVDNYAGKMRALLTQFYHQEISEESIRAFIISLIKQQDPEGYWGLIPSPQVGSDIRVLYWYQPTYIATSLLMGYLMRYKLQAEAIPEFIAVLSKGLQASTSRGLAGHGHDCILGRLEGLKLFAKGSVSSFIEEQPNMCPAFNQMIETSIEWLKDSLREGKTKGDWNEDYTLEMLQTARLFNISDNSLEKNIQPINIFVYGTLMKGQNNHKAYLSQAQYKGEFVAEGFALYDLGYYPGVRSYQDDLLRGEVYCVDLETLNRIDDLEGEGSLYRREEVRVTDDDGNREKAYIYVYKGKMALLSKIPFMDQPWKPNNLKNTHIWYAAYGSNLLSERFMHYINGGYCRWNGRMYKGCSNQLAPIATKSIKIPYQMYYGNNSGSWDNGGVAFLDTSIKEKTLGKMYLITKGQLEEIWEQEGNNSNWYNKTVDLGTDEDIPIVTFTNTKRRPAQEPSQAYLEVMAAGIKELCLLGRKIK